MALLDGFCSSVEAIRDELLALAASVQFTSLTADEVKAWLDENTKRILDRRLVRAWNSDDYESIRALEEVAKQEGVALRPFDISIISEETWERKASELRQVRKIAVKKHKRKWLEAIDRLLLLYNDGYRQLWFWNQLTGMLLDSGCRPTPLERDIRKVSKFKLSFL